jgi:galactokinase
MATPDIELFVPGRVCLLGEHSDWSGSFRRFNSALRPGRTIVVGTNCGLHARVRPHPSALVLRTVTDRGAEVTETIPMQPRRLLEVAQGGGFWSYAAGVAYKIMTDYRVGGLVIDNHTTTIPLKKGLSSSAAYCVLVARAFNRVYDLKMTTRGEMEYAYQGEIVTPSRCGRMDQACAFGNRPVLMTCVGLGGAAAGRRVREGRRGGRQRPPGLPHARPRRTSLPIPRRCSYDGDFTDVATLRVPVPLHLVLVVRARLQRG